MKKCLSALLAACILMTFAACGNNSDPASEDPVSGSSEATAPVETGSSEATDATGTGDSTGTLGSAATGNGTTTSTKKDGTSKTAATTKTQAPADTEYDIKTAPLPTRKLDSDTLSYFSWVDITKNSKGKPDPKSMAALFKKEFDVELEGHMASHSTYWDTLATLKASGKSPDVVQMPDWNYYPICIVQDLVQPLDDYIDFSQPLWADSKETREKLSWNGKTYVSWGPPAINSWLFYNKKMFRDNGVKTPREYYLEDNWTWEVMQDLADQFVHKATNGAVDTWGLAFQNADLMITTGIDLVEPDEKNGYKFNMRDPKLAKMMNMLYEMGSAGTGSLALNGGTEGSIITRFVQGKIAMIGTVPWLANAEGNDMRRAGNLDWVPLPKMDKNSSYYFPATSSPAWGIAVGAKHPQTAACFIEFSKWHGLGDPPTEFLPKAENAARIRYKTTVSKVEDPNAVLTEEEQEWTRQIVEKDYPMITNIWQSWLGTQDLPGYAEVVSGEKTWSAALEEVYPINEALLKAYFK